MRDDYFKEYYLVNKDRILEKNKEYRIKNRDKVNKIVNDLRKKRAIEFKEQGQLYCFLPKTERQNKMVKKLSDKKLISLDESREMLEKNNWNIVKLLGED